MRIAARPARRRWVTRGLVTAAHLLLVLLLLAADRHWPRRATPGVGHADERLTAIELRLAPRPATPHAATGATRREARRPQPPPPAPGDAPPAVVAGDSAVSAHIDWAREAERVARAPPPGAKPTQPPCEDTDRPGAMRPRCTPRVHPFQWGRDPRAVEFAGPLPYVHLGQRCVLGLGCFGCGIGALPQADGHLFDARQDPDRPRSSVPEVPRDAPP